MEPPESEKKGRGERPQVVTQSTVAWGFRQEELRGGGTKRRREKKKKKDLAWFQACFFIIGAAAGEKI